MKTTPHTDKEKMNIEHLNNMIESCYTYGGATPETYNFNKYIFPYIEKLGSEIFEKVYTDKIKDLTANYSIKANVYTDCEGLNYNSLNKIT